MNNKWKWILGFTLVLLLLLVPPLTWRFFLPLRMMGNANGWHMPMMYGVPGMMSSGLMFLVWLILLGALVLIGLGIAWLVKELAAPNKGESSRI